MVRWATKRDLQFTVPLSFVSSQKKMYWEYSQDNINLESFYVLPKQKINLT